MSEQDLDTFQAQLEQVQQALKADPENEEMLSLADQLKELIALTEQTIAASRPQPAALKRKEGASSAAASTSTSNGQNGAAARNPYIASSSSSSSQPNGPKVWTAGDECLAKYSADDKWYPARITSVGGSEEKRVYSVVFKGYNSTEIVAHNALKRLPPNYGAGGGGGLGALAGTKRKLSKEDEEERERKKKKNEKKLEVRAAKAQEQDSKKQSWQKFATKGVKKGVGIAGVAGTSIFKTPDNPYGKVGVTGSGRGMTEVSQQKKHKFEAGDEE